MELRRRTKSRECIFLPFLFLLSIARLSLAIQNDNSIISLHSPKRKLQHSFDVREGCFGYSHTFLRGNKIYKEPVPGYDPDECCGYCQALEKCVAWEYRACCGYCELYSEVDEVLQCSDGDCVSGIIKESVRFKLGQYLEPPQQFYRGREKTCGERKLFNDIGNVMAACHEVKKQCAPASKILEAVPLPFTRPDCEMVYDVVFYGTDYNNGFTTLTLTPEDCCELCIRDRTCHAWTRLASGQCWLKYDDLASHEIRSETGSVSGRRMHFNATWKIEAQGILIYPSSPSLGFSLSFETKDDCGQACVDIRACLSWSFFDGTCHILFTLNNNQTRQSGAVSANMVTVAPNCSAGSEDLKIPLLNIARAYDVQCASILEIGPKESRSKCEGLKMANDIFKAKFRRMQEITLPQSYTLWEICIEFENLIDQCVIRWHSFAGPEKRFVYRCTREDFC